jgi:hypothetical protein
MPPSDSEQCHGPASRRDLSETQSHLKSPRAAVDCRGRRPGRLRVCANAGPGAGGAQQGLSRRLSEIISAGLGRDSEPSSTASAS